MEIMSIREYMEFIGIDSDDFENVDDFEDLRDLMDFSGYDHLWDYPLEEIDHIIENEYIVVKVYDYNLEARYFQIEED